MYHVTIKTPYNTIEFDVEDYNAPEVQEILMQPYVEEFSINKIDPYLATKVLELERNKENGRKKQG